MQPTDLVQFWPGYEVVAFRQPENDTRLINLEPQAKRLPGCRLCGRPSRSSGGAPDGHVIETCRISGSCCRYLCVASTVSILIASPNESIGWLAPASHLTRRPQAWFEGLLQLLPISHVSRLTGLHWQYAQGARKAPPGGHDRRFRPIDARFSSRSRYIRYNHL